MKRRQLLLTLLGVPVVGALIYDAIAKSKSTYEPVLAKSPATVPSPKTEVNSGNESSNGEHMMVAVTDLGIDGEFINFNNKRYLLLETTTPIVIGQFDWSSFKVNSIINLN